MLFIYICLLTRLAGFPLPSLYFRYHVCKFGRKINNTDTLTGNESYDCCDTYCGYPNKVVFWPALGYPRLQMSLLTGPWRSIQYLEKGEGLVYMEAHGGHIKQPNGNISGCCKDFMMFAWEHRVGV